VFLFEFLFDELVKISGCKRMAEKKAGQIFVGDKG
jgi:hypothetical protein